MGSVWVWFGLKLVEKWKWLNTKPTRRLYLVHRIKYINVKNPLIFHKLKYFYQIKIEISHPIDQILISRWLGIHSFSLLNQFQSKPNPNRGQNLIFSPPNFTKSEITFKTFCSGFQFLQISKIWTHCTRNPLTDLLTNSLSWINASGQVCVTRPTHRPISHLTHFTIASRETEIFHKIF